MLVLSCICVALVIPCVAVAGATAPKGELSASEYQHLQSFLTGMKKAYMGELPNWKAAHKACLSLGDSTDLLRSTRTQCLGQLSDLHTSLALQSQKCSGTVLAQLICLNPAFQTLARVVPRLYAADLHLRAVGLARGLKGNCLISLVATKQQLATEKVYARSARRVAAAVAVLVKAAKTATPGSTAVVRVENEKAALDQARELWLGAGIAYPLSVCPHT
jgi:hypothetical protein